MERLITDGLETIHIQRLYTEACCAAAIHSAETGLGRHPPATQLSCDYPSENRKNYGFSRRPGEECSTSCENSHERSRRPDRREVDGSLTLRISAGDGKQSERCTRIAGDDANRLLAELSLVGVHYRRQPLREIGGSLGRDNQDLGASADDLAGVRATPLAVPVESRKAVGKVRRNSLGHEVGPFGIGHRCAPLHAAAEEQLGDQHPLLSRQ
jgi:hypothetical protein